MYLMYEEFFNDPAIEYWKSAPYEISNVISVVSKLADIVSVSTYPSISVVWFHQSEITVIIIIAITMTK